MPKSYSSDMMNNRLREIHLSDLNYYFAVVESLAYDAYNLEVAQNSYSLL